MSKKQKMIVELCTVHNQRYIYIKGNDEYRSIDLLVKYLDSCKRNKEIANGKKICNEETTQYVYEITDYLDKYSFVVRVKNSEKDLYFETIKYMDTLCDLSATLKKVNRARVAAGLFAGAFIMVAAGPSITKEYQKINESRNEYQEEINTYDEEGHYIPTEEEKQKAEEEYYERLRKQAEQGDEEAAKEYQDYLIEQLILEQIENESKKTR